MNMWCVFVGIWVAALQPAESHQELQRLLLQYNWELRNFNHLGAEVAWNLSTNLGSGGELLAENEELLLQKNLWSNEWCLKLLNKPSSSLTEMREIYLVCRGPRFSSYQLSNLVSLLSTLRTTYDTAQACLRNGKCYRMEPDLNNLMEKSRDEGLLREAWTAWHHLIGRDLTQPYVQLVKLMNTGARQAGHADIGSCWREELETPDLVPKALELYSEVKPLYRLLHAYVRARLGKFYGLDLGRGPIPAHLLGNMWSQRWDSLMDILWPEEAEDGKGLIRAHIGHNATVHDMVKYAERFYMDMGFPPLPPKVSRLSYFESNSTSKNCHGSAANMFGDQDFRVMMCAEVKDSDLQTLVHELGHIHYFMAYEGLPTVFQDGANAAFHEAVGDSVTYGMYPKPGVRTLLRLALTKLPQVAFGLVVDLWRWKAFETEDEAVGWNNEWWKLNREYLGIVPPEGYRSEGLDALGKYHIVDNVPYIRYFFGSFLQMMFYDAMCDGEPYCSLEGRGAGLRRMMSCGSSAHWSATLKEFTGQGTVSASALLKYFQPLRLYLEQEIEKNGLTVGW